jgi:hypothetical protein
MHACMHDAGGRRPAAAIAATHRTRPVPFDRHHRGDGSWVNAREFEFEVEAGLTFCVNKT